MAKRKAAARGRKGRLKIRRSTARKPPASARKRARRAVAKRSAARKKTQARKKVATAKAKSPRKASSKPAARQVVAVARPRPTALDRERRRLADDDVVPSPPSTLGYSPKASQAESGHQMLAQRIR